MIEEHFEQVPPSEPHMHQSCEMHIDTEVRLRIVEQRVIDIETKLKDITTNISIISHDIKNLQQTNAGLVEGIKCLHDSNVEIMKQNALLHQALYDNGEKMRKEIHDTYQAIIKLMIIGVAIIVVEGVFKVSSHIGL